MGPPSSGGVTVLQILGMLDHFALAPEPLAAATMHLLAEASRLAFADRNAYLADPDFVDQPVAALLEPRYLAARALLIDAGKAMGTALPGLPQKQGLLQGGHEGPSTTHLVVADSAGDVVSLTATVENAFGSRRMATLSGEGGFLLNNQLTDFSFAAVDEAGLPVANRPEPGKRPRSSMAPTIVLDAEGKPVFALGTPGGSRIIGFVALALVGLLDWGLDPAAAAALPLMTNRNGTTDLEANRGLEPLGAALEARGHAVSYVAMTSGLAILAITPEGLLGGADPRREGLAAGD
jgi:gamma-glutamyltranspeptidase/glutathione hydrolase